MASNSTAQRYLVLKAGPHRVAISATAVSAVNAGLSHSLTPEITRLREILKVGPNAPTAEETLVLTIDGPTKPSYLQVDDVEHVGTTHASARQPLPPLGPKLAQYFQECILYQERWCLLLNPYSLDIDQEPTEQKGSWGLEKVPESQNIRDRGMSFRTNFGMICFDIDAIENIGFSNTLLTLPIPSPPLLAAVNNDRHFVRVWDLDTPTDASHIAHFEKDDRRAAFRVGHPGPIVDAHNFEAYHGVRDSLCQKLAIASGTVENQHCLWLSRDAWMHLSWQPAD